MRSDFAIARPTPPLAPGEVEIIPGDPATGMLLLCDHASNAIPPELESLGLPPAQLERHIKLVRLRCGLNQSQAALLETV